MYKCFSAKVQFFKHNCGEGQVDECFIPVKSSVTKTV